MWSRADGHFFCSELDYKFLTILENPITNGDAFMMLSLHVTHLCHRDSPFWASMYPFTVSPAMLRPQPLRFEIYTVLF